MQVVAHAGVVAAAGGGAAAPSLPLTDLLAAWESDPVWVIEEGTGVSSWVDWHGGFDAVQATDGKRPTLTPSIISGLPTLDFNGTSDALIVASGPASTGPSHTTYIVMDQLSTAITQAFTDSEAGRCMHRDNSGSLEIFDGSGFRNVGAAATGVQVLSYAVDGSGPTAYGYRGVTALGSSAMASRSLGGAFGIGANYLGTGAYSTARIAAIFVYDAFHGTTERAAVAAFTTSKYGTP